MAAIPTLETQRLILSAPTLTDAPAIAAMWSDAEVVRHIGNVPFSAEDSWARLLKYVGHWQLLGYGTWIVRDKAGEFVGEVGLFDLHRAIEPAIEGPEAGWVLARSAHRKGYATEAVQAALAWGEQQLGARTFTCIIDNDNTASLRVAEKCGFREHARTTYKQTPVIMLRR
ncbi:MAG TPA: GNAT family N-acetyltransferase [Kofleriaceae bacterium]